MKLEGGRPERLASRSASGFDRRVSRASVTVGVRRLTANDGVRVRTRGDLRRFAGRRFGRSDDERSRGRSRERSGRDDRRGVVAAIVVIADVEAETTEVQAEAEVGGLRGVGRENEERGAEERDQGQG